jgi:hypothetical protein
MNEMTWRRVMDWEQLHCEECKHATLLKFQGRPHDLRFGRQRQWGVWVCGCFAACAQGSNRGNAIQGSIQ